jgi:hypothetical protein
MESLLCLHCSSKGVGCCLVPAVVGRVLCVWCALWGIFFRALQLRVGIGQVHVLESAEDGCVVIIDGNEIVSGESAGGNSRWMWFGIGCDIEGFSFGLYLRIWSGGWEYSWGLR